MSDDYKAPWAPKFKPGHLVAFVTGCEKWRLGQGPQCFMVVESVVQTCPGGTQIQYVLGGHTKPGDRLANEIELVAWGDPIVANAFERLEEECRRQRKEENAATWGARYEAVEKAKKAHA